MSVKNYGASGYYGSGDVEGQVREVPSKTATWKKALWVGTAVGLVCLGSAATSSNTTPATAELLASAVTRAGIVPRQTGSQARMRAPRLTAPFGARLTAGNRRIPGVNRVAKPSATESRLDELLSGKKMREESKDAAQDQPPAVQEAAVEVMKDDLPVVPVAEPSDTEVAIRRAIVSTSDAMLTVFYGIRDVYGNLDKYKDGSYPRDEVEAKVEDVVNKVTSALAKVGDVINTKATEFAEEEGVIEIIEQLEQAEAEAKALSTRKAQKELKRQEAMKKEEELGRKSSFNFGAKKEETEEVPEKMEVGDDAIEKLAVGINRVVRKANRVAESDTMSETVGPALTSALEFGTRGVLALVQALKSYEEWKLTDSQNVARRREIEDKTAAVTDSLIAASKMAAQASKAVESANAIQASNAAQAIRAARKARIGIGRSEQVRRAKFTDIEKPAAAETAETAAPEPVATAAGATAAEAEAEAEADSESEAKAASEAEAESEAETAKTAAPEPVTTAAGADATAKVTAGKEKGQPYTGGALRFVPVYPTPHPYQAWGPKPSPLHYLGQVVENGIKVFKDGPEVEANLLKAREDLERAQGEVMELAQALPKAEEAHKWALEDFNLAMQRVEELTHAMKGEERHLEHALNEIKEAERALATAQTGLEKAQKEHEIQAKALDHQLSNMRIALGDVKSIQGKLDKEEEALEELVRADAQDIEELKKASTSLSMKDLKKSAEVEAEAKLLLNALSAKTMQEKIVQRAKQDVRDAVKSLGQDIRETSKALDAAKRATDAAAKAASIEADVFMKAEELKALKGTMVNLRYKVDKARVTYERENRAAKLVDVQSEGLLTALAAQNPANLQDLLKQELEMRRQLDKAQQNAAYGATTAEKEAVFRAQEALQKIKLATMQAAEAMEESARAVARGRREAEEREAKLSALREQYDQVSGEYTAVAKKVADLEESQTGLLDSVTTAKEENDAIIKNLISNLDNLVKKQAVTEKALVVAQKAGSNVAIAQAELNAMQDQIAGTKRKLVAAQKAAKDATNAGYIEAEIASNEKELATLKARAQELHNKSIELHASWEAEGVSIAMAALNSEQFLTDLVTQDPAYLKDLLAQEKELKKEIAKAEKNAKYASPHEKEALNKAHEALDAIQVATSNVVSTMREQARLAAQSQEDARVKAKSLKAKENDIARSEQELESLDRRIAELEADQEAKKRAVRESEVNARANLDKLSVHIGALVDGQVAAEEAMVVAQANNKKRLVELDDALGKSTQAFEHLRAARKGVEAEMKDLADRLDAKVKESARAVDAKNAKITEYRRMSEAAEAKAKQLEAEAKKFEVRTHEMLEMVQQAKADVAEAELRLAQQKQKQEPSEHKVNMIAAEASLRSTKMDVAEKEIALKRAKQVLEDLKLKHKKAEMQLGIAEQPFDHSDDEYSKSTSSQSGLGRL